MSDTDQRNPKTERAFGAGLVVALHVVFTALTWVIATGVLDEAEANELIGTWLRYLGFAQGVYVIPAALTVALLQRWPMLIGIGIMAGLTAAISTLQLAM